MIEYYELTEDMRYETLDNGELAYKYGVILNYLFNMKIETNLENNLSVHIVKRRKFHT